MAKFCSECGFKLEEQHKFCPNCGQKVGPISSQEKFSSEKEQTELKKTRIMVCENCGGENQIGNKICSDCGVPLKGEEKEAFVKDDKPVKENTGAKKLKTEKSKSTASKHEPKKKHAEVKSGEKQLDTKTIVMISSVFAIIVLIILYSSGVFESGPAKGNVNQGTSTGVDLTNLQELNDLEERVKANPEDLELLLHLAHLQNDSRLYEKAIQNYKKYLEIKPEDADARVDMGVCYYNLADYPAAVNEMEKAIEYQPDHQIAHLNLGIVNLTAGNLEVSKEWFKKTVDLNPDTDVARRAQELLNSH
jgi:TolA-binding protein